jgi:hypothetical protein
MAAALFAQLILQQTNMAMMLMGKIAHPESGQIYKDVEAARLFIDQLEMLETKTKGNLTKEESGLLKQSLMNLRLAFVEAVDSPPGETAAPRAAESAASAAAKPIESSAEAPASAADDEHRKKFSKKY